jgi:Ca2+-binding EF-hand superfamily protein
LDFYIPRHEIDLLIWEVDEDSDGVINNYEFELMYKRSIFDKTQLEPR